MAPPGARLERVRRTDAIAIASPRVQPTNRAALATTSAFTLVSLCKATYTQWMNEREARVPA